jgi:hypothetical protein
MGIVDNTRMKIIRRLCMCFWLPMIREWMGSSLIAYYSKSVPAVRSYPFSLLNRFCHPRYYCQAFARILTLWCPEPFRSCRMCSTLLHNRTRGSTHRSALRRHCHDCADHNFHRTCSAVLINRDPMGRRWRHVHLLLRVWIRMAGLRLALLRRDCAPRVSSHRRCGYGLR